MKTLKYAWLGMIIVLVGLVLLLKKFPEIVSYDYYYRYLNVYTSIFPKEKISEEQSKQLLQDISSQLKEGIKYPLNDEFVQEPTLKINEDSITIINHLKFKNYHDCYMYLLHHRTNEQMLLSKTSIDKTNFVRKSKITYIKQNGSYDDKKEKDGIKGSIEISAICKF